MQKESLAAIVGVSGAVRVVYMCSSWIATLGLAVAARDPLDREVRKSSSASVQDLHSVAFATAVVVLFVGTGVTVAAVQIIASLLDRQVRRQFSPVWARPAAASVVSIGATVMIAMRAFDYGHTLGWLGWTIGTMFFASLAVVMLRPRPDLLWRSPWATVTLFALIVLVVGAF